MSEEVAIKTFEPVFGEIVEFPNSPLWRITCADGMQTWGFDNPKRDLGFASLRDCKLAIQSFIEAGITTDEQMEQLTDDEMAEIACRYLGW